MTSKATYQSQQVEVVRPAKQGDAGFKAGTEQVVIRLADGTEKTVAKAEVTTAT